MTHKTICAIFILFAFLLSSCHVQDDKNDLNLYSSDNYSSESETSTTQPINSVKQSHGTATTIETTHDETIIQTPGISLAKTQLMPTINEQGLHYNDLTSTIYHYSDLTVTEEFVKYIGEEEYESWLNRAVQIYEDYNYDYERLYTSWTDLSDFHNLYQFISEFNLSEQQVREALLEWNEFGNADLVEKHIYSEEEIEAISTKNKNEITRLFATPLSIVKGDKIYAPGWFFYSSIEDYQNASITTVDLITLLNNCKTFKHYRFETPFGENNFRERYLLDLVEYKAYHYLNNVIDVKELCGYDRDFNMPMAYEIYSRSVIEEHENFEKYDSFFNTFSENGNSEYNIIKKGNIYSPHWVYYNKPAAYKEAGITGDELVEMVPKYKELGILSEEAYEALEEKIYAYAESFVG